MGDFCIHRFQSRYSVPRVDYFTGLRGIINLLSLLYPGLQLHLFLNEGRRFLWKLDPFNR